MAHDHPHHRPGVSTGRFALVLALTVSYTAAEVIGGILTNSLALLADAGHMMTDNVALGLALAASWFARRPPDAGRTYGYQRVEILVALVNGVALVLTCGVLFWEAFRRLADPPEVRSQLMGAIALGGLAVNIVGALLLRGQHGLNERAAFLHLVGDLLGSVGAIVAAVLIGMFGWRWADPAATFVIGAILLFGTSRLVLEALNVLLEGTPRGIDFQDVHALLVSTDGVTDVHDLHVWSLGGRVPLLTAHLVVDHSRPMCDVLKDSAARVHERFGIDHVTLQIEPPDFNVRGPVDK